MAQWGTWVASPAVETSVARDSDSDEGGGLVNVRGGVGLGLGLGAGLSAGRPHAGSFEDEAIGAVAGRKKERRRGADGKGGGAVEVAPAPAACFCAPPIAWRWGSGRGSEREWHWRRRRGTSASTPTTAQARTQAPPLPLPMPPPPILTTSAPPTSSSEALADPAFAFPLGGGGSAPPSRSGSMEHSEDDVLGQFPAPPMARVTAVTSTSSRRRVGLPKYASAEEVPTAAVMGAMEAALRSAKGWTLPVREARLARLPRACAASSSSSSPTPPPTALSTTPTARFLELVRSADARGGLLSRDDRTAMRTALDEEGVVAARAAGLFEVAQIFADSSAVEVLFRDRFEEMVVGMAFSSRESVRCAGLNAVARKAADDPVAARKFAFWGAAEAATVVLRAAVAPPTPPSTSSTPSASAMAMTFPSLSATPAMGAMTAGAGGSGLAVPRSTRPSDSFLEAVDSLVSLAQWPVARDAVARSGALDPLLELVRARDASSYASYGAFEAVACAAPHALAGGIRATHLKTLLLLLDCASRGRPTSAFGVSYGLLGRAVAVARLATVEYHRMRLAQAVPSLVRAALLHYAEPDASEWAVVALARLLRDPEARGTFLRDANTKLTGKGWGAFSGVEDDVGEPSGLELMLAVLGPSRADEANEMGFTPLMYAARRSASATRRLLELGASPHRTSQNGMCAVDHAVHGTSVEALQVLLQDTAGAGREHLVVHPRVLGGTTHAPIVRYLSFLGVDLNARFPLSSADLQTAYRRGLADRFVHFLFVRHARLGRSAVPGARALPDEAARLIKAFAVGWVSPLKGGSTPVEVYTRKRPSSAGGGVVATTTTTTTTATTTTTGTTTRTRRVVFGNDSPVMGPPASASAASGVSAAAATEALEAAEAGPSPDASSSVSASTRGSFSVVDQPTPQPHTDEAPAAAKAHDDGDTSSESGAEYVYDADDDHDDDGDEDEDGARCSTTSFDQPPDLR